MPLPTRPALSEERLKLDAAGQVVLELKTAWRDGTTHRVMSPLVFMQRLAALVPRPRLHLIRFHGVVAPNARLRAQMVPQGPAGEGPAHEAPVVEGPATRDGDEQARPARIGWARLLARVLDIDVRHCPICAGAAFKILAAILDRAVIEKILRHLGLDPRPPSRASARPVRHHGRLSRIGGG